MSKRVLLCLSHSIEEYDQLKLLSELGYEVASIGGYIDPSHPHDTKRPALPEVPCHQVVKDAVDALGTDDNFGAAQARIPEEILDWLGDDGVIIFHHYLSQRLFPQWRHLAKWRARGGRVVWRTVGQSVEQNELDAAEYRENGLEIVRYSPKEKNIPGYVGGDALIRFWKDPDEWTGWTGDLEIVTNVTQSLRNRGRWCNYDFWADATRGLNAVPAGEGSETHGGQGLIPYDSMKALLRSARCYLYTGTQPASYTLGLLEALVTGIPVVSIGPSHMDIFPYGPKLFEGHELTQSWSDDPELCRNELIKLLNDPPYAADRSDTQRRKAIALFGKDAVGNQWADFLGAA